VRFQPLRGLDDGERGDGTFDFLGLTHYWAKSRRGYWVIKRRTAKKRLWRAMRAVWHWCRAHRHDPIRAQYRALCQKLRGHYQYYGIRGNYRKLEALYRSVERAWRYWLSRRGGAATDPKVISPPSEVSPSFVTFVYFVVGGRSEAPKKARFQSGAWCPYWCPSVGSKGVIQCHSV
jgi:hypothetical protein